MSLRRGCSPQIKRWIWGVAATIINLIGGTKTRTGLKVKAVLDTNEYETGIKVADEQLEEIRSGGIKSIQPGTTRSHLAGARDSGKLSILFLNSP
jgi:hypothetical protein